MVQRMILAGALALALAGCNEVRPPRAPAVSDPKTVWCDQNTPRRPTAATIAVMSRADLDDMNQHNRRGAAWCEWKP